MSIEPTRRQILGAAVATLALPVLKPSESRANNAPKPNAEGWVDTSIEPAAFKDKTFLTVADVPVILVRVDKKIVALTNICTHKACSVKPSRKKEGVLYCPCHSAEFDATGAVLKGPAEKPLSHQAIRLTDKTIHVNLTKEVEPTDKLASITI